jgi:peptide/nickel transport system ATP-binding protein
VETGDTAAVLSAPRHPYTRGLLQCHPALHEPGERLTTLEEAMAGDAEAGI